tara:strand:+ start:135 stop:854 length:720 start_codon:yes stop_codon:yes gene_type:complete
MEEKLETFVIISKRNETERYKFFLTQVINNKLYDFLNIHYFNHCWKTDITSEIREKYCKSDWTMKKHGRNMKDKPLTNGEISLFLNWIFCLKQIRETYREGNFLILESDAIFANNFNEQNISKILKDINLIENLDILNIGEGVPNYFKKFGYPKTKPITINDTNYYKENLNRCTEAIIWKYKSICKFLDYFEKKNDIDGPIDTKMDVLSAFVGGFNIFWPKDYLIRQGSNLKLYNSTIR